MFVVVCTTFTPFVALWDTYSSDVSTDTSLYCIDCAKLRVAFSPCAFSVLGVADQVEGVPRLVDPTASAGITIPSTAEEGKVAEAVAEEEWDDFTGFTSASPSTA